MTLPQDVCADRLENRAEHNRTLREELEAMFAKATTAAELGFMGPVADHVDKLAKAVDKLEAYIAQHSKTDDEHETRLDDLADCLNDLSSRLKKIEETLYTPPDPQMPCPTPDLEAGIKYAGFDTVGYQAKIHNTQTGENLDPNEPDLSSEPMGQDLKDAAEVADVEEERPWRDAAIECANKIGVGLAAAYRIEFAIEEVTDKINQDAKWALNTLQQAHTEELAKVTEERDRLKGDTEKALNCATAYLREFETKRKEVAKLKAEVEQLKAELASEVETHNKNRKTLTNLFNDNDKLLADRSRLNAEVEQLKAKKLADGPSVFGHVNVAAPDMNYADTHATVSQYINRHPKDDTVSLARGITDAVNTMYAEKGRASKPTFAGLTRGELMLAITKGYKNYDREIRLTTTDVTTVRSQAWHIATAIFQSMEDKKLDEPAKPTIVKLTQEELGEAIREGLSQTRLSRYLIDGQKDKAVSIFLDIIIKLQARKIAEASGEEQDEKE